MSFEDIRKKHLLGNTTKKKDEEEEKKSSSSSKVSSGFDSIRSKYLNASTKSNVTVDDNYIKSFTDSYKKFVSNIETDLDSMGYKNGLDVFKNYSNQKSQLLEQGDNIKRHLYANKGSYSQKEYDDAVSYIEDIQDKVRKNTDVIGGKYGAISQYKTEEEYNDALKSQKDYAEKKKANLDDIDAAISELEKRIADEEKKAKDKPSGFFGGITTGEQNDRIQGTDVEGLKEELEKKQEYRDEVAYIQNLEKYSSAELYKLAEEATDNDDYLYYLGLGNAKDVREKEERLSNETVSINGREVSVLKAMQELSEIEDSDEKKNTEDVLRGKLSSMGMDFDEDYSLITGNSNVTWGKLEQWAGATGWSGLEGFNKGFSSTFDLIFGKPLQSLGWEDNPISSMAEYYDDAYNNAVFNRELYSSQMGGGELLEWGGKLGEGTIAAVPDLLLALMTSGASKATTLAQKATYESSNMLTKAGLTVQSMMKNPSYWTSFARTYGTDYEEAIEMGASEEVAVLGATISSLVNAGIEIGTDGGSGIQGLTQDLLDGNKNKLYAWVESALEEGGEEVVQGLVNNLVSKVLYDENAELINVGETAEEFVLGTAIGGILGGGQTTVSSAVNKVRQNIADNAVYREHGQSIIDADGVDYLRELASEVVGATKVKEGKQLSKDMQKATAKPNAKNIGKLSYQVESVRKAENLADIEASLVEKGLSQEQAKKAAEYLSAELDSGEISIAQFDEIMSNADIKEVRKAIEASDSSVNKRNQQHKLGRYGIKVTDNSNSILGFDKNGTVETEYDVSADGKTINRKNDKIVSIKNIESISESGEANLTVDDGMVVKASDLSFGSDAEAIFIENIGAMKVGKNPINLTSANAIYQTAMKALAENPNMTGTEASSLIRGLTESYIYGTYNLGRSKLTARNNDGSAVMFAGELSQDQRKYAYELGQKDSVSKAEADQKVIDDLVEKAKPKASKKAVGKVIFEEGANVDENTLTPTQKANLDGIKLLAEMSPIEFHVFQSDKNNKFKYTRRDGTVVTANGWYVAGTNEIWIDINAGNAGEGTMLRTAAHEISHYIKDKSPVQWKAMADLLMKSFAENGVDTERMLNKQIAKIKRRYKAHNMPSYSKLLDMAYEEFVSDALTDMLTDGSIVNFIAEVKAKDKNLAQKILDAIKNFLKNWGLIIDDYKGRELDTDEAKELAKLEDTFKKLQEMYRDAFMDANEVASVLNADKAVQLAEVGIGFDEVTGEVFQLRDSFATNDSITIGKKTFNIDAVAELVAKVTGRSIEDARKWVNSEMTVANIIMANPEFLDFEADDRYEAIKKNSDYPQGTVDLSNLCPKRSEFTSMFDMLQRKYPNKLFTASDVAEMRSILADNGITVACGACFVEDRRQLLGEIADTYINMWKEAVETGKPLQKTNAEGKKVKLTVTAALAKQYGVAKGSDILATDTYIPTQYDLTTYEGFRLLEKNHPTIAMGFNRYNNSRGQQSGRLIEGRAEYKRQILGWTDAKVKSVNNNGGLRIFSFSDFEVVHLLDLVQVIIDCAAKGVKIQGYTKIPAFAKLVRNTGIKLNRSFIPKGDTGIKVVNGKKVLDIDTTEGIDTNDENFIDESDNPNVGNVIIGINPEQIGIAMLDDNIDYIIPFHSNKAKSILEALGLKAWANYKESQHEKDIGTGKASKHNVNIYTQVINKYQPTNKVEFVESFLKECKRQGKIPRYAEFLHKEYKADGAYSDEGGSFDYTYREGYHKFLVDFKMFDREGNILPQENITPNLDDAFMTELLNAEVDKKANYEFPKEVYDQIEEKFGGEEMFSMRESVEETKDLLAFHNITESLLWDAIHRKGLLMPSVAVTNKGMTDFGEISLVFDKSVIDPAINKDNKLYGADAWTPTQTELKKNAKFDTNKTVRVVNGIKNRIGAKYASTLFNVTAKQFRDTILKADGSIYDAYSQNLGMQTAYALENGIISSVPTKNGTVDTESLSKQIHNTLDKDVEWRKYKKWLRGISDDIITSYDKASNEDILQNMKAQPATAKTFKLSENGELVVPAVEYSSIDEMRNKKNRLSEKAEDATKIVADKFLAFAQKIGDTKSVVNAINATFANRYSVADIVKSFSNKGVKISTKEASELQALYKEAVELPTQYFEAKPAGEISLDKANTAVVPKGVSTELRQALENLGINVLEYNGTDESRVEAMNSLDEVMFSERDSFSTDGMSEADIETAEKVIGNLKIRAMASKYVDGFATYMAERMEREIRTSSSDTVLDYAKSYITWVNPTDFIYATTTSEQFRQQLKDEAGTLDIEKLRRETQPIHLTVDFETGEIVGHEGRHRMLALQAEGVDKVAVVIDAWNDNRHHTKPIDFMRLKGQKFAEYRQGVDMYLSDVLPLSKRYADVARKFFTNKPKGDIQFSERDYPIDANVENTVNNAFTQSNSIMHELSDITPEQNKAINRLVNQSNDDSYRGKYEGGKHRFSDDAIRHIIKEHGDFLREGLRAQLPMTPTDIARHLSAIKANKEPSNIKPTKTKQGNPSILTSYEVNGYTLYAEELKKPLGQNLPSDLIGHTMYKAPTLSTAAFYTTSVQTQPKRQSVVLCEYNTPNSTILSRGNFVADANGLPALLNYIVQNGSAKQDARVSGLIALSSDSSNFTDKSKTVDQGYVLCQKPFYITQDNRVFSNSETNVAEKINELKKQGYDCFIFDKTFGDNYMVAVVNKAQIIEDEPDVVYSERDTESSNRSILANALEGVAQTDIEKNKLAEYREKIDLINQEEQRLSEIQKKLFTKGEVDSTERKELQFEAKQIANRINTYDRQLLRLEATKPLQNVLNREKALAAKRQKQKDAEAMREYKEQVAKTTRELITRNQESRKKAIDSRNRTAVREKIKRTVNELNTLLLKGSKERNVKLGLQPIVAKALEVINMDTVGAEERIAKLEQDLMKAKTPEAIQEISRKIDNIRGQGDKLADKLEAMRKAYADIRMNGNNEYAQYYQQEAQLIEFVIADVIEKVGDTSIRNMSLSQLEAVHNMYKVVLQTVRYSNELHTQGKVEELRSNASSVMEELEKIKTLKEERAAMGDKFREFSWNEMIPVYAFRRIGSQTLEKFFWEMIRGQNTFAQDVKEANDFSSAIREKYGHKKWDLNKVHEFKLPDGRTFRLTLEHMMSIYAYSKREQAFEHMTTGGFFFNNKATFRRKGKVLKLIKSNEVGYTVDFDTLEAIKAKMEKEAEGSTKYVDEMQQYLTNMGEKGNEVSRVVWGIDIFKEKVYFPLKSSKDFISQANQTAQETSLKHDGMTKETKPGASNPIVLEAFDDVWASHVNRMSQYHGFVIPIDNMNKLVNYGSWAGTASISVSTMLEARFSGAVNEYLNQFIKDMNGASSASGATNPFFSFVGKFKKTAVAASMSVVAQQPTAILRASAVMDSRYFVGLPDWRLLSTKWNELQEYAPIAIIKEIGGFDAGAGRQASEWLNADTKRGIDKVESVIDDVTMKGAAIGDQIGWCAIWEAVKREVKATTKLEVGSKEFLKKCGERFTEVVVMTQVYDSTLSRSGYMRSKHDSVKMLTAFMGEPTVSFNMMYDATLQAKRKTITKRNAVRRIGATYVSIIAASVAASLIYALRDDDEDESYLEKLMEALGGKLLGDMNPLNILPGVRDVMSIFDGWDVERTDMSVFKDIKDAFDGLSSENKSLQRKIEDFAGAVASAFGVPLKNTLRTGREIYNLFKNIFDDITPKNVDDAFVRGITGEKKDKGVALYDAIVDGDDARLEVLRKGYKDDKAYENAVRKALRENDPRIKEAAEAFYNGDAYEYADITDEIIDEGNFDVDDIKAAIKAEYNKLTPDDGEEESGDKAESIFETDHYFDAVVAGDNATAHKVKEDIIDVAVENGKDREEAEKSFCTSFKKSVREGYADKTISRQQAMDMLTEYGGMESDDAYWQMKKYDYYATNGTEDGYSKYGDFYESVQTGRSLRSVIQEYTSHGVKTETLASQITQYFKPLYKEMTNAERAGIKGYLLNAYQLLGYNRYKKNKDINDWLKD